jgi:hypothetical protein
VDVNSPSVRRGLARKRSGKRRDFALVMTLAGRFPELRVVFPNWLYDAFNPNDKTNLAPYRIVHLAFIILITTRFFPRDLPGLTRRIFSQSFSAGSNRLRCSRPAFSSHSPPTSC